MGRKRDLPSLNNDDLLLEAVARGHIARVRLLIPYVSEGRVIETCIETALDRALETSSKRRMSVFMLLAENHDFKNVEACINLLLERRRYADNMQCAEIILSKASSHHHYNIRHIHSILSAYNAGFIAPELRMLQLLLPAMLSEEDARLLLPRSACSFEVCQLVLSRTPESLDLNSGPGETIMMVNGIDSKEIALLLLKRNYEITRRDFLASCVKGDISIIKTLWREMKCPFPGTEALEIAIRWTNLEVASWLLDHGAVLSKDLLLVAIKTLCSSTICFVLEKAVDTCLDATTVYLALSNAIVDSRFRVLEHKSLISVVTPLWERWPEIPLVALRAAITAHNQLLLQWMLNHCVMFAKRGIRSDSVYRYALAIGNLEAVDTLLAAGIKDLIIPKSPLEKATMSRLFNNCAKENIVKALPWFTPVRDIVIAFTQWSWNEICAVLAPTNASSAFTGRE